MSENGFDPIFGVERGVRYRKKWLMEESSLDSLQFL